MKDVRIIIFLIVVCFFCPEIQTISKKCSTYSRKLHAKKSHTKRESKVKNNQTSQSDNQDSDQEDSDDKLTSTVVANFANMVQNFFQLVQDPNNLSNVGSTIAGIFSGIINIASEAMKKIPLAATEEERQKHINTVETALKTGLNMLRNMKIETKSKV
jgi:hypothetical protein